MITGADFTLLLFFHFIGDFFFQNDWMALNKSKKLIPMMVHCFIYTIITLVPFIIVLPSPMLLLIPIVLYISHLVIDFLSSKLCEYLYNKGERHWFFVVIGFDQFLHLSILSILFFP